MDLERLSALRHHALLSTLEPAQLARIAPTCQILTLTATQMLFQRGSEAAHFYIVLEGRINLSLQSRDGNEKIIDALGPGRAFAEALMFAEIPTYPVTAMAVEESRVLSVSNGPYLAILRESPATCLRLLGDLSRRLHVHVQEIETLAFENATNRLVNYLLAQTTVAAGPATITLSESKQALASRLAVKPETVSRTLRALTDAGLLRVEGRTIHVLDVMGIRQLG